jgi:flagellin
LTAQGTFTQTLSNSLTSGVGSLVDADMNQASTRLNALQTQQQLGIQSLSIANQNSQMILKLFGL